MFYKYAADITYITESGRRTNKQVRTWVVSPKRKKREVFGTFLALLCICGYRECVPERNFHTATRNTDILLRWPTRPLGPQVPTPPSAAASLWPSPFPDCRYLLFVHYYATFLSSSSSGLVGNLARKPFVWASCQNRQRNPLTGAHPHPQNECPSSCHLGEEIWIQTSTKLTLSHTLSLLESLGKYVQN